jgi:hypothetical protein
MLISKAKRAVPVLVCAGALVVPAAATAKAHKLSGQVGGDPNATVSMKVVVKKGDAKKVKAFAWSGLDGSCGGEQSGTTSLTTKAFPSPFRIFGPYQGATDPGDTVDIPGSVKKKGKKVVGGLIAVYYDGGFCTAPPLGQRDFTATK